MAQYAYVKLVQHGSIAADQTWSTGLAVALSSSTPPTEAELSTWLASLDTAYAAWWHIGTGVADLNAADTTYDGNRCYYYPAGQTAASAQANREFSGALPGSQSAGANPQRTCCVSSMITGSSGRSFRGRRYLPATGAPLTAHQFGSVFVDHIVAAEVAFLDAVGASSIAGADLIPIVANNRVSPPSIQTVRVNSLPDTQRRRTDKVGAIYTAVENL